VTPLGDLEELHPAVVRAREMRSKLGLDPSLTDLKVLGRVAELINPVARTRSPRGRRSPDEEQRSA